MNPINKSHKCPCDKRNNLVIAATNLIKILDKKMTNTLEESLAVSKLLLCIEECTKPKIKKIRIDS